jgi:hypothetical protein
MTGEILGVDAMLCDEGGITERLREIGEYLGMECAKSVSLVSPYLSIAYMASLYHIPLFLT